MHAPTTCSSARRDNSVSRASSTFLNASAAVQLAPTICAYIRTSCVMRSRNVSTSKAMHAAHAISSATVLVTIASTMSLRLMDRFLNSRIPGSPHEQSRANTRMRAGQARVCNARLLTVNLCKFQELGADLQPRAAGGVEVDLEAHLVRLGEEAEHAAVTREAVV